MRIISGEFRGRRLLSPLSDATRPITDRAKQSLFDSLSPATAGSRVYDCFAGTGSMGLECLSRGAQFVTFFEADPPALALLKKNVQTLALEARSQIVAGDLFRWFDAAGGPGLKTDLIFLDPPYRYVAQRPDDLRRLARQLALHAAPDGILIFRHDVRNELELPPFKEYQVRKYGKMAVEFLRAP
ncbi:MAG TPA: 16S rRNA (guanine(966)-N(2))-methyltransferase RsmD [Tepidisphaeraceae bacterium]|nr:16S rRNA (guanine(966)-N(2))-methyltransferase RsmD [Tepidisphaeraceae bacterium]